MGILTPTSAKPCSPTALPFDNNSPFCCMPPRSCRSGIGSRLARAKAASEEPTFSKPVTELLQLRVLHLGLLKDGDVWIGSFPQRQKILVGGAGFGGVAL